MLRDLARSEHSCLALVFESEVLAVDADDDRVVQDAIEHRHCEHAVAGESSVPAAEGEIRCEDHRAAFVALRDNLEEQVGRRFSRREEENPKTEDSLAEREGFEPPVPLGLIWADLARVWRTIQPE
jgi:hypothetical protein